MSCSTRFFRAARSCGTALLIACGIACALEGGSPVDGSLKFSRREVLSSMRRVANWQLNTEMKTYKPTDWTMGTLYAGVFALASLQEDSAYEKWLLKLFDERTEWRLGRYRYYADDQCVGQVYLELYLKYRKPAMIADVRSQFDAILKKPSNHGLEFQSSAAGRDEWCWCDALFMAPPTWMRLYAATGERKYMDFAVERWWKTSDYLYDPAERLYFRDNTFFKLREKNGKKVFWSRGNGWVMAGLVRVLQFLPKDHPERPRFEQQFREIAGATLACQQSDGLWTCSLLAPERNPLGEASGSAFFCYAYAWGVTEGLLDRALYEPAAARAWQGLLLCVTPSGKLTHVQQPGDAPARFKADNSDVYAVGGFLLAGTEMYRLAAVRESTK